MSDNWKHRSKGMRCRTCMFFVKKEAQEGETGLGRCRRHSPTMSGFPAVFVTDWCGDHKLDENKIDRGNLPLSSAIPYGKESRHE